MSGVKDRVFGVIKPTEAPVADIPQKSFADKEAAVVQGTHGSGNDTQSDDEISKDAQAGVQAIEAFTKVWTTSHIVIAYITYVLSITQLTDHFGHDYHRQCRK